MRLVAWIAFRAAPIVTIAAFFLLGAVAAMQLVGINLMLIGIVWAIQGDVPVGWRGHEPSFWLTGNWAMALGVLVGGVGLVVLAFPLEAACLVRWERGTPCP